MANTRSTPRPKPVVPKRKAFDLDTLEREDTPEPFAVLVKGEEFLFHDPMEFDWQDAIAIDPSNLEAFVKASLGDGYDAFAKHRMPLWKLLKLAENAQAHYGMLPPEKEDASSTF